MEEKAMQGTQTGKQEVENEGSEEGMKVCGNGERGRGKSAGTFDVARERQREKLICDS